MKNTKLSVIVWNEFINDRQDPVVRPIYPEGLHSVVAQVLKRTRSLSPKAAVLEIATATQDLPEQGLGRTRLETCDVLIWCGLRAHDMVSDEVVNRIHRRVLEGMGLIVLHSGHPSKILRRLLGTNSSLSWRTGSEKERLCLVQPSHPIAAGLAGLPESSAEEVNNENFADAPPDSTIVASQLKGGEIVASGCCWERGYGRMFYFRPGNITPPTFKNTNVQRILANAVQWVAPRFRFETADLVTTKIQPHEIGGPYAAVRTTAERRSAPPGHIDPAPLFPTLMDHLRQQSEDLEVRRPQGNDFRKNGVESDRLVRRA